MTQEIPRENWNAFFDELSRTYRGQMAIIEVRGPNIGRDVETRELPFEGITVDWKGSGAGSIDIILGQEAGEHLAHIITAPTHVHLEESEGDLGEHVEIKSADGSTVRVRFRSFPLPDWVDEKI